MPRMVTIAFSILFVTMAPQAAVGQTKTSPSVYRQRSTSPVRVRPHVTNRGTYVQPHVRTAPNKTRTDNWGSKGNVNPYTGKAGKIDPYQPKKPGYR